MRRAAAPVVVAAVLASCANPKPPAPRAPAPSTPAAVRARAPAPPPSLEPKDVDAALRAEWARAGIAATPRVDDARWLRRAYIDVVGTIPPPEKVRAFVADGAPDKRAKVVDALLASPAYAEHWKTYWEDELLGPSARAQALDRVAFRRWLRARFAENAPWDRIASALVAATGGNGGGAQSASIAGGAFAADDGPEEAGVNGAVNWILRYEQSPQDLAGAASRELLGVQIQCAQCHDHKTEAWKRGDFWSFAAAFARARAEPREEREERRAGHAQRVEVVDLDHVAPRFKRNPDLTPLFTAEPRALGGAALPAGKGTRRALAAWMTSKDNPYFARAFVNRMWGHFLGRGFVDPVDDMRASNPATAAPLLDELARDFAAHGYDIKRLVRTIALTEAYQLAPGAPAGADPENKMWSRFRMTPMGPEELLNAIAQATGIEGALREARIGNAEQLRAQIARSYAFLFDVDEDADAPSYEGTVSQALALLNGTLVGIGSSAVAGGALDAVLAGSGTDAEKIDALYIRALARPPNQDELATWLAYIAGAAAVAPRAPVAGAKDPLRRLARRAAHASVDPKRAAFEDLLWTLLNTSEFLFNH